MPSSDLVLNVRQIAGYAPALSAVSTDSLLLQRGLGGPYLSISPAQLVATALSAGGGMTIGGPLSVQSIQGGSLQMANGAFGLLNASKAEVTDFNCQWGTVAGLPIATQDYVDNSVAGAANVAQSLYDSATVWSFNQRTGQVILNLNDVMGAGGAPIWSPVFQGCPSAPTPAPLSRNTRLATTEWVWGNIDWSIQNLLATQPFVFSFNGRTGDVTLQPSDIQLAEAALLDSPPLTGTPTAPTAPPGTSSDQLATTQFVANAINANNQGLATIYAPIDSPAFTGTPTGLTAPPGTSTGQLATTAFVMNAVQNATAGVATFNTRTGNVILTSADLSAAGGALLASPVFTGTPQAPTAAPGANTSQIATCAWVLNELGGANVGVMSFNGRGGAVTLNTTDIVDAGGAPIVSPNLSGVPTAPTAASGTSTNQLATTAFVEAAIGGISTGVTTFNGRTGAITLTFADVSAAGGATLASPAFTGVPTAPTATPGTSTTQLATTAFVMAALAAGAGVTTFNTRSGAVTLTAADITGATGYLSTGGNITGPVTVTTPGTAVLGHLNMVDPAAAASAGNGCYVQGFRASTTAANVRWVLGLGDGTAESGGATGAGGNNFNLVGYNNSGQYSCSMTMGRSSGDTTFSGSLSARNLTATNGAVYSTAGIYPNVNLANDFYITQQQNIRVLNWGANWYDAWDFSTGNRVMVSGGNTTHIFYPNGNLTIVGRIAAADTAFPIGTIGGVSFVGGTITGIANINGAQMGSIGGITLVGGNISTNGTLYVQDISASGSTTCNYFNAAQQFAYAGGLILMAGGNIYPGVNNGVSCGIAGQAWFQCAAYAFAQQSDPRDKRDISPATQGALAKVKAIIVQRFRWKEETPTDPLHIGWMADEVQDVLGPATVKTGDDARGTLSVNLSEMVATLWQAVQELSAEVATLKARPT